MLREASGSVTFRKTVHGPAQRACHFFKPQVYGFEPHARRIDSVGHADKQHGNHDAAEGSPELKAGERIDGCADDTGAAEDEQERNADNGMGNRERQIYNRFDKAFGRK